jgi:hypothetical protein
MNQNSTYDHGIKSEIFKFRYIPDFSNYILNHKLEEFVTVGIRFCREVDLPMMRSLAKLSEKQLTELSLESNREMLTALADNNIGPIIKKNISNFIHNEIKDTEGKTLLDQSEVLAEDIILIFYLRRKLFNFFLHAYTQNAVVHMLIAAELDFYTTQEQLLTTKAIIDIRKAA